MAVWRKHRSEKNAIVADRNGRTCILVKNRKNKNLRFRVDEEDVDKVRPYRWFSHNGYCCTIKDKRFRYLHWHLMGKPRKGYTLYYLNGDRRDNRKCNLQKLTWRQRNLLLLYKREPNKSTGVIGVSQYSNGLYVVAVGPGNKRKSFRNKEEAIAARMVFERQLKKVEYAFTLN